MKLLLGAILTFALFILGYFIYRTYKEKHTHASLVRRILALGLLIVFFNIVSLFTRHEWICVLAYAGYFIAADWMLYYLLRFSISFIGKRFEDYVKKWLMVLLLFCDSILIAFNNQNSFLYTVTPVEVNTENFFELNITPVFYAHFFFSLLLATFTLIALFYGSVKAPLFYRKKYFTLDVIIAILVLLHVFSFSSAVDISIIGYVVAGVSIYYFAFVYSPQKLLPKTLLEVSQHMDIGLFVIDVEGTKLYSNKIADDIFNSNPPLVTKVGKSISDWCKERYLQTDDEFIKDFTFYKADEERIIKIQLQRMRDGNKQLQGGYFTVQDRTEEIANLKREQYLASHDRLTGFLNRDAFYDQVKKHLKWNPGKTFYMICTDIKDFKLVNDFLGSKSGDIVLINYANMLKTHITGAYEYARLNNDIFAILMPKNEFSEDLFPSRDDYSLFENIDKKVILPIIDYIGIYEITESDISPSVMCDRARMAIQSVKGDLHKRFSYYDNHLRDNIIHEQELINNLKSAIAEGQLQMYLQPQMSSDGKLLGAEALVRWIHPEKGMIFPGDFIPVFERNGLISDVDLYIWECACKLLRKWKDAGRTDLHISVNISPRDFYFLNIYQTFTSLVAKYDLDPKNLKLEITETAVVMDFQRQMDLINRLRRNGFVVEMDDFGSGYSSLNMLKDIYVDVLKIDMAFLKKANDEERSRKILEMIISLSNNLGMPVITEGVETEEQLQFLIDMGCHMFQGYFFSKPVSVETFENTYITNI